MKLLKSFLFSGLSSVLAEKCSKSCGTGLLSDGTVCNLEPCSFYDSQNLLTNGRMESDSDWSKNGGTVVLAHVADSYDGSGYQVTGRAGTWNGILQEFNAERVIAANLAGGTMASSIYVRPLEGATLSGSNAKFQFKVRFRRDGQNTFFTVGEHTYQSGDDLTEWIKLSGTVSVPADLVDTDEFRFYVECTDASLSFEVDHAYAVDNSLNQSEDDYLVANHDFELGDGGWIAPSITIVGDGTSPSGNLFAKVSGRTQSSQGIQQSLILDKLESDLIEISFWARIDSDDSSIAERQDVRAKINCFTNDGSSTQYLSGTQGCDVLGDDWFRFHGTADVSGCREIAQEMIFIISGPAAGVDMYFDKIEVTNFVRDRSWKPASDLRIEELRKNDVTFKVTNPDTTHIEVKMLENGYPFGAIINKHMMNDDYQRENWPVLFNYGVTENEMKWRTCCNKDQATQDHTESDRISAQFTEWGIPLRGHAVVWSIFGKNPGWFDTNPTLEELYFRVDDIVNRYKGQIECWDVFNEPLHGDSNSHGEIFIEAFGEGIWNEIMERVKAIDPDTLTAINDYELARSDKGRCFNKYTEDANYDIVGLQSHMFAGLNGHFLKNRFDTMADPGRRLWVTELDFQPYFLSDGSIDMNFKAEDLEDFMRQAFSHSKIDGILLWKWLWHEQYAWMSEPVTKHFFDSQNNPEGVEDNGTWPFHPTAAGMRWIDLVKDEWNSTTTLDISAFSGDEVSMNVNTRLFYGDYEINQLDENGNILGTDLFTLTSEPICSFDSLNMLSDGEFDDMTAWTVSGANPANLHPYKITRFGAYEINSLLIQRSEEEGAGQVRFTTTIPGDYAAGTFDFSLLAKWDSIKSISVSAEAFGGEVSVIPWANYESADWGKYSVTLDADRSMSNEELTIIVKGIEGDFMIDHILLTSNLNTEGCKSSIDLEFTPAVTCDDGFVVDTATNTCENVNECENGTPCGANAECNDNDGSFVCECHLGWNTGASDAEPCEDVDECLLGSCVAPADCNNFDGGFTCSCPAGYTLNDDSLGCNDNNECENGDHNCDANAGCTNIDGSFECACNGGFSGSGTECEDDNECDNPDACPANAACTNFDGGFECTCKDGFGRSLTCDNLNECNLGTHNCHANAICTDTTGSFECNCLTGFEGSGQSCKDVNECDDPDFCGANADCTNLTGGFSCTCKDGFGDNAAGECVDIKECETGDHTCDDNASCTDTEGSFECECNSGWDGDGHTCDDVDECIIDVPVQCPDTAICTDFDGGFSCECKSGFTTDDTTSPITCNDIDECTDGSHTCDPDNGICNNNDGSFECSCQDGWAAIGGIADTLCSNIDECLHPNFHNCDINAKCDDNDGSFTCTCLDGFTGDGTDGNCVEDSVELVDECALGTHDCDLTTTICEDTDAGYLCNCKDRYLATDSANTCVFDIDSCDSKADLGVAWKGVNKCKPTANNAMFVDEGDALAIKCNIPGTAETAAYTGFNIFTKKYCGSDFIAGIADGRIRFEYADKASQYETSTNAYLRDDKDIPARSSATTQWTSPANSVTSNTGNTKKDIAWLIIKGLKNVDMGSKSLSDCLVKTQVGIIPGEIKTQDETGCVGNQKNVNWRTEEAIRRSEGL